MIDDQVMSILGNNVIQLEKFCYLFDYLVSAHIHFKKILIDKITFLQTNTESSKKLQITPKCSDYVIVPFFI